LIDHHGKAVPVLDLTQVLAGRASNLYLSTKIIILDYYNATGEIFPLAVLAERILATLAIDESAFADSGVATPEAPYIGPVANTERGVVQRLELQRVLPPQVRERLFSAVRNYETESA
jgi:chemotaxis-related protein WspB